MAVNSLQCSTDISKITEVNGTLLSVMKM